jgi:hypothetical protein
MMDTRSQDLTNMVGGGRGIRIIEVVYVVFLLMSFDIFVPMNAQSFVLSLLIGSSLF